jgi:Tol biopolymer transport system component
MGSAGVKLASAAAALMLFVGVAAAHATPPGKVGKLAFIRMAPDQSSGGRSVDLYTADSDGSNVTNLTNSPSVEENDPAWSPDGQRIVFTAFASSSSSEQLYVTGADGSNTFQITFFPGNFPCVDDPAWSPATQQKIAFTNRCATVDGHSEISVINADGSGMTNVSNTPGVSDGHPAWSPDGAHLAFTTDTPTPVVFRANPDGSGRTTLFTGPPNSRITGLDWSPNGAQLALSGTFDDPGGSADDIYTIGQDGTGLARLTSTPAFDAEPSWYPDGSKIAFHSCTDDTSCGDSFSCMPSFPCDGDLLAVDPADDSVTPIISGSSDTEPNWQAVTVNSYARPKGARAINVALVPAYRACSEPNNQHGDSLAFPSCSPPQLASDQLTVGTADSNLRPAAMLGNARLDPLPGDPATPQDDADMTLKTKVSDVFNKDLTDYTGELSTTVAIAITDRDNTPNPGGPGAATTTEFPLSFTAPCVATDDASIGSTCSVVTTADALVPDTIKEGRRAIWQAGTVRVYDGGPDGLASTTGDNTLFATQGVFVP